jgi:anti-sigma factor RsiW
MEMALINRFVASCTETRELLSDYVDGELSAKTRRRVLRHLLMCRRCRAVLWSLRQTIAGLQALGSVEPAPDSSVAGSVLARVRSERDGGASP